MAPLIKPRLLKGFRDALPQTMLARRRMLDAITRVFESFGFVPLETPALEYSEVLLGKYGAEGEKLLYRFEDNGGRDVALRYDLTVPLARVAAQYRDLPRPFRRYQIGPVWRAESPQKGRFREFLQCDVDVVGTSSLLADAECLAVDYEVMRALDVDVTIRLNNRKVFRGLQALLGIDTEPQFLSVLRAIDKLERDGKVNVRQDLTKNQGLAVSACDTVFEFIGVAGDNDERLAQAEGLFKKGSAAAGLDGLAEIRAVLEAAGSLGVPAEAVVVDPSIARGLDYYTGTVFETQLNDLPAIGSVMSGGRYDDLVSVFLGEVVPAVGISVGLDRLMAALEELGRVPEATATAQVYVAQFTEELAGATLDCARRLREAGINVEIAYEATNKLKRQIQTAVAKGIAMMIIIGPDEAERGLVTLRDLSTREQETVSIERAIQSIREHAANADAVGAYQPMGHETGFYLGGGGAEAQFARITTQIPARERDVKTASASQVSRNDVGGGAGDAADADPADDQ